MEVITENSSAFLQVVRRDTNGELSPPTSLEWRLDCLTTKQAVQEWTEIETPDSPQEIPLTAELNAMQGKSNPFEDKQVVIRADNGLSTQEIQTYTYRVRNVQGVE